MNHTLALLIITFVVMGCSPKKVAINQMADLIVNNTIVFEDDSNLDFVEKAIPSNLKLLEILYRENPSNTNLALLLSKYYGLYSFAFYDLRADIELYSTDPKVLELQSAARATYKKGSEFALSILEKEGFSAYFEAGNKAELEKILALKRVYLEAAFFFAFNYGLYINLSRDNPELLSKLPAVAIIMELVLKLDENFFFGGSHLFYLFYYASRSKMLGGSPEEALKHYEKLKVINKNTFLLADLFFARYYAVQVQDEKLFTESLEFIQQAKADVLPGFSLGTALSKRYSKALLERKGEFFEEGE